MIFCFLFQVKEDGMLDFDAMHMVVDKMMTPTVAAETKMSVNLCMDTGKSKILNIF
jgi:hypothetical protein